VRVVMVSKALVVGEYQRKLRDLAACSGIELTAVVPPSWRASGRTQPLERVAPEGYRLVVTPISWNGHFHLHYYPYLGRLLEHLRPDVLHIDEEPYNLATYRALRAGQRLGAKTLFFSWQNLSRHYPPPFGWLEQYVYAHADAAIAGTQAAAAVLHGKGYDGELAVIPQFGVDPEVFAPRPSREERPFTIGYAGRLVAEKGLRVLLEALGMVQAPWRLAIRGAGPLREEIMRWFARRSLASQLDFADQVPSAEMPAFLNGLDLLVLPSLSRPNWQEQFGRVLVEAMACEVPVVGSDSGEIPEVLGDGGLTFSEGRAEALAGRITELRLDPARRRSLGRAGRQRVLEHYTHARIAAETAALYARMLQGVPSRQA